MASDRKLEVRACCFVTHYLFYEFPRAVFCIDFLLMKACMNERLTTRPPDLEVRGSSLARRVVYLDKELNSTLSSPRCINGDRRQTGDGLASLPSGKGGNTPRHASC